MIKRLSVMSYLIASLLILGGGTVYLAYRPLTLKMFTWTNISETSGWLSWIRSHAPNSIPEWSIYALPDGLWACSYALFIGTIWQFSFPKCIPVALLIPAIGIVSELLQKFRILPGVYDFADMIAYILGGLVGVIYIYIVHRHIISSQLNAI